MDKILGTLIAVVVVVAVANEAIEGVEKLCNTVDRLTNK